MLDNSTIETLKAMHCSAMASELENQLNDSKTYGTLAFEERIALMVDAEWNRRQQNKLQKLIKEVKDDLHKWRNMPCLRLEDLISLKDNSSQTDL